MTSKVEKRQQSQNNSRTTPESPRSKLKLDPSHPLIKPTKKNTSVNLHKFTFNF